jgi:hypothetical protein
VFNATFSNISAIPWRPVLVVEEVPRRRGFVPGFVNYKKECTELAAASDKFYQLLAHDLWFSPGTTVSSTNKSDHHDIVKISLKMTLNTINQPA